MTPADILRLRLANHGLSRPPFHKPEDVVAWFGAVQAQDYLGALWALGLRTRKATEAIVEAAETRRAIVRTWPMRGTLHFVAAADARWMTQLLAPRVIARNAARLKREVDVDAVVAGRSRDVAARALEGGQRLERGELYERLEARGIATGKSRGLHILLWLAMEGTICLAGRQGKQHTFALLDEWIPKSRPLERDAALAELARRYFTSHGPATRSDFMWWAGITANDALAGIDGTRNELVSERIGREEFWWRPARGARRNPDAGPLIKLLPGYDEYTVAYQERARLVPAGARAMSAFGLLSPVVVIDGLVVGNWKRTIAGGRVSIATQLRRKLDARERAALEAASREYAAFLGLEARPERTRTSSSPTSTPAARRSRSDRTARR
jgi:hypothetical protein